jgi:hypothetical protein
MNYFGTCRTLTILFWCTAFCHQMALSQTKAAHTLSLSAGYGMMARQDLIFSPFVQESGSPLQAKLRYEHSKRLEQQWSLQFRQFSAQRRPGFVFTLPAKPAEEQRSLPHTFTGLIVDYAVGKRLGPATARSQWTLGTAVAANLDIADWQYGYAASFGYFMAIEVGVWGKWTFRPAPRQTLSIETRLPLLAWTARSPYLVNDDEFIENTASHRSLRTLGSFLADGQLNSVGQYQKATFGLGYNFALSRRWQLGATWCSAMIRHSDPLPLRILQHQLLGKISVTF